MSAWQPIETAPKDGTTIDVCNRWGDRSADVAWVDGKWRYWGVDGFGSPGWVSLDLSPTHWMPLPEPPK
jgi:hypothetical protein